MMSLFLKYGKPEALAMGGVQPPTHHRGPFTYFPTVRETVSIAGLIAYPWKGLLIRLAL